jgi:NitT/TauT family transport system substrate-binding protein
MKRRNFINSSTALALGSLASCRKRADANVIRFGHFPNITHVQGLVAHALTRQGKGWFEERLGAKIEWFTYNAGPSATEAIFAGALDVTYIGPSPALNAYAKSKGTEIRVLAGAANGGNSLVIRADSGITAPADFKGKKIASPQLGNTQDVQLRAWLIENGVNVTLTGGDASILPTQNPDQIALFEKKELDAVWTVEPWVTRLELEAGGKIFLEDKDTNVTLLAASAAFVKDRAELAKKLVAAHTELTKWIQEHAAEARALVKAELTEEMKSAPKDEVLDKALSRVVLAPEISRPSLDRMVASAQKVGFLKDIPDLGNLLPNL